MKKILILIVLIFFCSGSVFGGEFEDTLKKAEQGNAWAQYNLALMYSIGEGITQDYKQAVYWYKQAAEQGNAWAHNNLGYMYLEGIGVLQDCKQAVYWYKKAA